MRISFDDAELNAWFDQCKNALLGERATAMKRAVGEALLAGFDREIEKEGAEEGGTKWPPLKTRDKDGRSYRPKKGGRRQYDYKLLQDTGALRNRTAIKITLDTVTAGFTMIYGRMQNALRPFVVLRNRTRRTIIDIIKRFLEPKGG